MMLDEISTRIFADGADLDGIIALDGSPVSLPTPR